MDFPSAPGQINANWDSLIKKQLKRARQLYRRAREIRDIVTEQELIFQSHSGTRDAQCVYTGVLRALRMGKSSAAVSALLPDVLPGIAS
jgi:3-mercaptopyruvate sulfurtransferase SseA